MADNQPYVPLGKLLAENSTAKGKIEAEANVHGHDGFFPVPVVVTGKNGAVTVRGQVKKAAPGGDRGRLFLFVPTSEKVTVVRDKVGQSYAGDWIHEVISRDGKKFLASTKQLKETNG